jgi:hypothetical protein
MPSNQRSINTGRGKHWAGGGDSGGWTKGLREKCRENRSKEERQGVLFLEIYELRRIFDNFLFLKSFFYQTIEGDFFLFNKILR